MRDRCGARISGDPGAAPFSGVSLFSLGVLSAVKGGIPPSGSGPRVPARRRALPWGIDHPPACPIHACPPTSVGARIHFPRARRRAQQAITPGAAWVRATRRHDVARLPGPVTARTGSGSQRRRRRRAREFPSAFRRTEARAHGSAPRSSVRGETPVRAAGQNRHEALRCGRP